jgi:sRNA-binding protein
MHRTFFIADKTSIFLQNIQALALIYKVCKKYLKSALNWMCSSVERFVKSDANRLQIDCKTAPDLQSVCSQFVIDF